MAVRVRHHVNPHRSGLQSIAPPRLSLPPGPIEVELGCADAQFLFQLAEKTTDTTYVGVEIRRAHVEDVNRRAKLAGLPHLHAVHAHINIDLERLLSGYPVRRFYVNFPDPWFKHHQKNRRLMTPELAQTLASLLEPEGELLFQSDVFDLALDAMSVLEAEPALKNCRGEWSFFPKNPFPACSLREERVTVRNLPVWRILYRRAG